MIKHAVISECGAYRYTLSRTWDETLPRRTWVMLNPSTADANDDDPTIRRCINFSKRDGFGGLNVLNLFAFRSPNPADLVSATDPVGPDNYNRMRSVMLTDRMRGGQCVVAWGANAMAQDRGDWFASMFSEFDLFCLGRTKTMAPRHPLYVRGDAPIKTYRLGTEAANKKFGLK